MNPRRRLATAFSVVIAVLAACSPGGAAAPPKPSAELQSTPEAAAPPEQCDIGPQGELPEGATCWTDLDRVGATGPWVEFTVPAEGWYSFNGAAKDVEGAHGIERVGAIFIRVDDLIIDGCTNHRPQSPAVGPSAAELAMALAALEPFEVVSPPTAVTAYGYSGQHVQVRVPLDQPFADGRFDGCQDGELRSWIANDGGGEFYGYTAPGDTDEYWILDVDGTRLVVYTLTSASASPELIAERQEILDSVMIRR